MSALAAPRLVGRIERADMASLYRDIELPLTNLLARVEGVGILLDSDYLRGLGDEIGGDISSIERRVHETTGEQINLGSPKQLAALLFEKLGLRAERMKKTKTGYSTDHETLESMRGMHELIEPILEHRELTKLKGTYIDALPPLINPKTNRLHTTFRQAVTATGRLSSQEPNLQNIPIRSPLGTSHSPRVYCGARQGACLCRLFANRAPRLGPPLGRSGALGGLRRRCRRAHSNCRRSLRQKPGRC